MATGTAKYQDSELDLPTVENDIKNISAALEAVSFTKADPNPPLNPAVEDLRALKGWFDKRSPEDDVVLYYVGHGKSDDQHYLILQREDFASLDLVRTFARNPVARRILLVLDTCESGNASLDLSELWKSFEDRFRQTGVYLTLVTSCWSNKQAQAGTFTPEFARALRNEGRLPNRNQARTKLSDLLDLKYLKLPEWQRTTVTSYPSTVDGLPRFDFPNPDFNTNMPSGLDLESQRRLVERQTHWDDRVRYFTGRRQAVSDIEAFLAAKQGGVLVVTGDPGSGKSSLLAYFVLVSKTIDLSIHAKGRDLAQMMQIVSRATEASVLDPAVADEESRAKALALEVGRSGKPLAIAIDALDEALRPAEITRSLLATLAKCSNVRMVIGTRPDTLDRTGQRFQGLGSATTEIDLDSDRYFAPEDIEIYAQTRLLEAGPYAGNEPLAREAARAVARKAARTFLVAKLECDGLVNLDHPLDPGEIWRSSLPVDVKTAFNEYLDRFPDDAARREVFQVLQPLAFGFGQGLPSRIWEQLAQALSGEPVTAARIRAVLDKAGAYVVEAVEDGSSVYRLFHEKFAEFFCSRSDLADCHSRITSALLPQDWLRASYYTRRYLALHAAKAGRLDELLETPAFLVVADPSTLKRVVGVAKSDLAVRNAGVYSVVSHLLGANLAERSSTLALAATKFGYQDLSRSLKEQAAGCPWWPRAAQWQISPHFVIRNAHDAVRAVAVGERDGRLVVASGGDDGLIRFWDRETFEAIGTPLVAFRETSERASFLSNSVQSLAIVDGGKASLLARDWEQSVKAWNLETLKPITVPVPGLKVSAWSQLGNRCFAISITDEATAEIRNTETWELVREPFPVTGLEHFSLCALGELEGRLIFLIADSSGVRAVDLLTLNPLGIVPEKGCNAIAAGRYAGKPVVVTGTNDGDVKIWSFESFELLAGPMRGHQTYVDGVAVSERNGASLVVSGSRDSSIRIWTPRLGTVQWTAPTGVSNVSTLATGSRNGKPVVVSGGWADPLRVWDGETLEPLGSGTTPNAGAITTAERHGRAIVLYGGKDGVLRACDLETLESADKPDLEAAQAASGAEITAVLAGNHKGRSVAISATDDGVIRVLDLEKWEFTEKTIVVPTTGFSKSMVATSLALAEIRDRLRLFSAGDDGMIHTFDLETSRESGPTLAGHESVIYDLAVGQYQGGTVLASVSFDQTVRLWDLDSRKQLGEPLRGHGSQVHAVAIGKWNARPVVFSGGMDGTVRMWDLETHAQIMVINVDSRVFSLKLIDKLVVVGCARGLATIEVR